MNPNICSSGAAAGVHVLLLFQHTGATQLIATCGSSDSAAAAVLVFATFTHARPPPRLLRAVTETKCVSTFLTTERVGECASLSLHVLLYCPHTQFVEPMRIGIRAQLEL